MKEPLKGCLSRGAWSSQGETGSFVHTERAGHVFQTFQLQKVLHSQDPRKEANRGILALVVAD